MDMCSKELVLFWIHKIDDYLRKSGLRIDPLPKVILAGSDEQKNSTSDILISTGGYQPETKTIILYTDNRHIKDILRSYCHEMVHHNQNLENGDYLKRVYKDGDLVDSPELEEVEAEAYPKGNLLFRKFTEWFKKSHSKKGNSK